MSTQFDTFVNNTYATLASAYTAGSGSLVLTAGEGAQFGSTFPIRVTAIKAASYRTTAETLTIYTITGRTTDTLTGITAAEGTTDQHFSIGDIVEMRFTAGEANLITTAVNTLEAATLNYVTASLGTFYNCTASMANIGLSITLTAGTWLFSGALYGGVAIGGVRGDEAWITIQLYDSTNNIAVPQSASQIVDLTLQTTTTGIEQWLEGAITASPYTVTGSIVIQVQAAYSTAGSPTIETAAIYNDTPYYGASAITAVRIA